MGRVGQRLRRGGYLLPSVFTVGNMLLGFYAIVRGIRGDFAYAAVLIFGAGLLDSVDGRIARLTGTESDFGREYDSLADVLTFGAAPAWLLYYWGLQDLGRAGWLLPLFYVVCAATRLARFNVQTKVVDSRFFVGLPVPAAAATICSYLLLRPEAPETRGPLLALAAALPLLGVLMVSTFRYPSFKKVDLRQPWSYRWVLPIAAVVLVVAWRPSAILLAISAAYALAGPAGWITGRVRRRPGPPGQGAP
jgi:CDP-diacylglycerol--serine O-phosphatidyltransferase